MKTFLPTNPIAALPLSESKRKTTAIFMTDVTRGARLHSIRSPSVSIESGVIDAYCEPDAALGQNLVGVVLRVLSCHLGITPGGVHDDQITICAIRREDAALVELNLRIERVRRKGVECISLYKGEEVEVDEAAAQEIHAISG